MLRLTLLAQGVYFVATGIWANVHRRSFEWVSGRKTDYWLVRCVGVLVLAVGVFIGRAALRPRVERDTVMLAAASAVGLAAVEGYFAAKRRISLVYLLDAAAEALFVAGALLGWRRGASRRQR